jgi:hypothetical protein
MKENTFQPELSDFAFILGAICVGKTVFFGKKTLCRSKYTRAAGKWEEECARVGTST